MFVFMNLMNLKLTSVWRGFSATLTALALCSASAVAATSVYTQDFEAFTSVAKNIEDMTDANPIGDTITVTDDAPAAEAGDPGSGVQVIDWLAKSGSKSLLVRSASEALINLPDARSGSTSTLDFWLHVAKGGGDRNFYIIVRSMGSDNNGEDLLAYRSDRAASPGIFYYDGIAPDNGWINTGAAHTDGAWQHHRMVFNMAAFTFDLYIDDMTTPVVAGGDLSRSGVAVISSIIVRNEGNSADDGYFAIDDIALTVDGAIDLNSTFTEGFETYTARKNVEDDADPAGPWITTEAIGTGDNKTLAPTKVQVVDSSVVQPHTGTRCLKIEGGQRAGVTLAWGVPPKKDVQITWWARVPASVLGGEFNYLRMSLYGAEDGRTDQGDCALLGYGTRSATLGDETSLTYYTTTWVDTQSDFTPDTWEEYRLVTHNNQSRYSIMKNPSSANPTLVVDRAAYIGSAVNWGPMNIVAWSSSNGTDHPPVYIDDVEIKSLESNPEPLPEPYSINLLGNRFTNYTIVKVGAPVGKAVVDPRDNETILFTIDATSGAIFRASRTSSMTWTPDPTPVVTGISQPSGLAVAEDGTLWWTHDYTQALMRLKWPWSNQIPETVISGFGAADVDDDPIDLAFVPSTFAGTLGGAGLIAIADRGSDGDASNAIYLVDPATTELNQTTYSRFLVEPTSTVLGAGNLNGIAAIPNTGEVVTISQDGWLTAVNGDGISRNIWPATLWADVFGATPSGAAVAADPISGKLWVADNLLDELWSVDANPTANPAPDQKEVAFPLTNPDRPDQQLDVHDPSLAFSANGAIMVLTDGSTANGGGRLIIFHNASAQALQPYSVTRVSRSATGVLLEWSEAAPTATYRVFRSDNLDNPPGFADISGPLTTRTFTDPAPPAGQAFYRIEATQ